MMRILAIGNSHALSLRGVVKRPEKFGAKVDILPSNILANHSNLMAALRNGSGVIAFRTNREPFEFEIGNYDKLVIVGSFIGGDGIFRSLTDWTCFAPIDTRLDAFHPSQYVRTDSGYYVKPTYVEGHDEVDKTARLISREEAAALFDYQIHYFAKLMEPAIKAQFPEVWWFESPMPKRSVFDTIFGVGYVKSGQVGYVRSLYNEALAKLNGSRLGTFVSFPKEFLDDDSCLHPTHQAWPSPTDIHVGVTFGTFIVSAIR